MLVSYVKIFRYFMCIFERYCECIGTQRATKLLYLNIHLCVKQWGFEEEFDLNWRRQWALRGDLNNLSFKKRRVIGFACRRPLKSVCVASHNELNG